MPRDDVVDEAALRAMFEGYDKTADNAADINLEGSGRVICEMSSKQTLKFAIRMIDKATHEVVLTAFTFDVVALVETLSNAASRGAQVKVYVDRDHALRGTTLNMPARLSELVDAGVEVRLCRGAKGSSGIQHSKTLQCDQILIIGSTNWTNSSQNNQEISVAYAMNAEGLRAHTKRIEEMRESSEVFSEVEARAAIENRAIRRAAGNAIVRSKSVGHLPAEDKYRTARKFTIANGIRMGHAS
jgi:phosphatidylserine/phosphatidylglycerophosphate/cardiolipin synthase-like enzyme